jgi:DNA polymerase-1
MTALFEAGAPDVLYIVDLSGYVFRAYHAIAPLASPSGEPTHAVFGTVNMLERLVRQRRPAMLAVAMDTKAPNLRREVYPEYKAHRPPQPPDLAQQMERCRQIVDAFAIPCFRADGFEADDLIAAAVAQAREHGLRVVIVSADKDLMQLVGPDVCLWDTMRDKVYGVDEVTQRFGVPIDRIRDWLALTGDASDNVPGVPSVGPKTATELLTQFGSIDGIYENLDKIERKSLREKLRDNEAAARISRDLVTLRADVPCVFDPEKLRYGGRDVATLRKLYQELGFQRHVVALDNEPEPAPAEPLFDGAARHAPPPNGNPAKPAPPPETAEPARETESVIVLTLDVLERAVRELRAAGRFAVLVETSNDDSVRAALVGIGLAGGSGAAYYVPVGHRYVGAPKQLALEDVRRALGALFADPDVPKASHGVKHLRVVLTRHGFSLGGALFDTEIASYLLDPEASHELGYVASGFAGRTLTPAASLVPKVRGRDSGFDEALVEQAGPFAGARVDAIRALWDRLEAKLAEEGLLRVYEDIERPLTALLAEMEMRGVLVDTDALRALGRVVQKELEALERKAHEVAGRVFNVNSPRQLETLLFDELGLKPMRRTKTSRSTDAETLEALAEVHPLPKVILDIRQIAKLKGTYIDALPSLLHPESRRIHTRWGQTVAATGRLSSSDPNLQNIPIRSELGRSIRAAFVAPPGYELVSADYSQIELRVLAHLSKDPLLVDSFRSGEDVHTRTAMEVFGVAKEELTPEHRRRAKAVNFGIIYGQGDSGLAKGLGIPREEAAAFIAQYFRRYEGVRRFMNDVLEQARAGESVRTLFGRRRLLPDIRSGNRARRLAAERIAMNMPIQGTAADLLKLAMIRLGTPPTPGTRMVLTVHDELVFEVPEAEVAEATEKIRRAMETVHPLEVPLVVDVGHGKNWSLAH